MKFLLATRLRRPSPTVRLARLLVVAGPSGSGKSLFLRRLAAGKLPAEIVGALPAGAEHWPQTNGRRMVRRRLAALPAPAAEARLEGLVLHYDILRPFQTAIADYDADASLAVLGWADEVSVAMVTMPREDLAARLAARPPKRRRIGRTLARALHRVGVGTRGKRRRVYDPATEHARHRRLVALYATPGFLESWEARWNAYIAQALGDRLRIPVIRVESGGSRPNGAFHLVAAERSGTMPANESSS